MKTIWAPWRMEFITSMKKKCSCIFCYKFKDLKQNDKSNLVLYRGKKSFILMNLYPYSNGHLMIAPVRHVADYTKLDNTELLELNKLIQLSIKMLSKLYHPEGFNIGINLGKAAGAGIDKHLHIHIVPRWLGDNNFMSVISETKVIPESINATYSKLKKTLERIRH